MEETIATIKKNAIEEVRVALGEYRGHDLVNVRIWANYDSADAEKRPTKKGFALRVGQLIFLASWFSVAVPVAVRRGSCKWLK